MTVSRVVPPASRENVATSTIGATVVDVVLVVDVVGATVVDVVLVVDVVGATVVDVVLVVDVVGATVVDAGGATVVDMVLDVAAAGSATGSGPADPQANPMHASTATAVEVTSTRTLRTLLHVWRNMTCWIGSGICMDQVSAPEVLVAPAHSSVCRPLV
jgi:hypothetical protein